MRHRSSKDYDGKQWKALRVRVLIEAEDGQGVPRCVGYLRKCNNKATEVDHIISVRRAPDKRLDMANLQALCGPCHKRKTAMEDGALGHKPGSIRLKGADQSGIPTDPRHHWSKP